MQVLDLACDPGFTTCEWVKFIGKTGHVTGVFISTGKNRNSRGHSTSSVAVALGATRSPQANGYNFSKPRLIKIQHKPLVCGNQFDTVI